MAVIPIAWNLDIVNTPKNRELYDYPAWKDLGTVFGTKYNLKLFMRKTRKRYLDDRTQKIIFVQIERFFDLSSANVHGCISIYDKSTFERFALKAFHHRFRNTEKVYTFSTVFRRNGSYDHLFSGINLHGYMSVDLANDTDVITLPTYISSCPCPEVHETYHQLSGDLRILLRDNTFSDVTFKCGDIKFSAHKSILSARSAVFKAMFQEHTKESQTNEIEIEDMKPEGLKALLDYMYCAKMMDFNEETACQLLYAADKYVLMELKHVCVSFLKGEICNENVFRILELAILHDESLKLSCSNHIGEYFSVLEKSKEWMLLKQRKPDLVMEILSWIVKFGKD